VHVLIIADPRKWCLLGYINMTDLDHKKYIIQDSLNAVLFW
jgi:hypothetical protein